MSQVNREKVAVVRAAVKASSSPWSGERRALFQLYAFLRGRPLALLEPRVSEHNLPKSYLVQRVWGALFGKEPLPAELSAWLAVPEDRIKRFGPKLPRVRPSKGRTLLAAGVLALSLASSSPAEVPSEPREACLGALERRASVEEACGVEEVATELLTALAGE